MKEKGYGTYFMVINRKCILRLSRYKNALRRLRAMGFVRVFSGNLAEAAGVTEVTVRNRYKTLKKQLNLELPD